jgi:hypothetical protein
MAYMLLIVEPPGQRRARPEEEGRELYGRMMAYAGSLRERRVLIGTNSLFERAVRLDLRDGRPSVTDGPFTEAKEFIGGYFLIDCATRAEALGFAAECPAIEWATIEVRETGPCYEENR